jgi:hypothetical protein
VKEIRNISFTSLLSELNAIIRKIVSEQRQKASNGDDLLSTLLHMQVSSRLGYIS